MTDIHGKVVGLPSCADPATTGLRFSIRTAQETRHFHVAGTANPQQSPNSALAMSAILLAATKLDATVHVVGPADSPHVATDVVVFAPSQPGPEAIANPYSATVFSVGVLDRPPATLLQTNLNYRTKDSVYFDTSDADRLVHWATTIAFAAAAGFKVTIDWTPATERRMNGVRLG